MIRVSAPTPNARFAQCWAPNDSRTSSFVKFTERLASSSPVAPSPARAHLLRRLCELLAAAVVALLASGAAPIPPADFEPENHPNERQIERRAEQRVLSPTKKILEQMKSSVCGTGPIYAGSIDAPIFVRPLLNTRCTLTQSEP
jgi:hypothetical protein